ncbi:uncharacterized protein PG986_010149 [Apiospora aurea]|uniref:Uncharacterized protein n=1 Tax=Apiospora aurea TaxID=335848 RepID=A0ABR1Q9N7_9PEZI
MIQDYILGEQTKKLQELHRVFEKAMQSGSEPYESCRTRLPGCSYEDYDKCECGKHHISGKFCQLCTRPDAEQAMCNSMILGSITLGYRHYKTEQIESSDIKINGEKDANKAEAIGPGGVRQSLADVLSGIRDIKIFSLPEAANHRITTIHGKTHDDCNPTVRIHSQLDKVLSIIADDLGEQLEGSLDQHAKLTGLDKQPSIDSHESTKMMPRGKKAKIAQRVMTPQLEDEPDDDGEDENRHVSGMDLCL